MTHSATGAGKHAATAAEQTIERSVGGHRHRHGRPSSWILVSIIIAGFVVGGVAIIVQLWWLFWLGVAVVVVSVPVGKLTRIMDDTMVVEARTDTKPIAADRGSVADPGVRMPRPMPESPPVTSARTPASSPRPR